MSTTLPKGYSSTVTLRLIVGDRSVDVGQVGPNVVICREPVTFPSCEAELEMTVEGQVRRSSVRMESCSSTPIIKVQFTQPLLPFTLRCSL